MEHSTTCFIQEIGEMGLITREPISSIMMAGALVGMILFWIVIIMPYAFIEYLKLYISTRGTMIKKPNLSKTERKEFQ